MSSEHPDLEAFADATKPSNLAVRRVKQRVLEATNPSLSQPPEGATSTPLERLNARLRWASRTQRPQRPLLQVGLGAALAALVGYTVLPAALPPPAPVAPPPVSGPLASEDWSVHALRAGVTARLMGQGSVRGDGTEITWQSGTLELTVDPAAQLTVDIQTQEAQIEVLGTILTVDRNALGTRVGVARGMVRVTCADQDALLIAAGESELCLPTTAGGLLGRAQALESQGASSEAVLQAVEQGLAIVDGPVEGELRAFRIQHLLQLGRSTEALEHIDAYVASGTLLRRTQMLTAGSQIAEAVGGCKRALPYLRALDAESPSPDTAKRLKHCSRKRNQ